MAAGLAPCQNGYLPRDSNGYDESPCICRGFLFVVAAVCAMPGAALNSKAGQGRGTAGTGREALAPPLGELADALAAD